MNYRNLHDSFDLFDDFFGRYNWSVDYSLDFSDSFLDHYLLSNHFNFVRLSDSVVLNHNFLNDLGNLD